jgi:DNA-binding CsgD family transcriptional regulator
VELFEREEALAELAGLREAAFAGRGSAALVSGPVAVGKSALLDTFIGQAAQAGGLPLTAIASDAERALQLGVLAQFVLGAQMPAEERDRISELIAEGSQTMQSARTTEPPGGAQSAGSLLSPADARVADRICTRLVDLSAQTPLAIVVDDVQHADASSLICLSYLVRRVRDARIIVVFGHSDQSTSPNPEFRIGVLRQPHSHALSLRPLSYRGVVAMLTGRLGESRALPLAAECYRASGGNPLLVGGLLDDQRTDRPDEADWDDGPGELTVRDGYAKAVLACLRRGGAEMLAAAQGIAVLDGHAGLDRLLQVDAESAVHTLFELEACGLIESGRFRHAAARSAVLADLDGPTRAGLHLRAAELGYEDGRPATLIAEHLRAARRASAAWSVPVLEEASRQALAEGRVGAAIDYLKLACDSCADEPRLARLKTTLVRAEWRINPGIPAQHLAGLVEAMHAGHLTGSDALVLARALLLHGRTADATDVLTQLAESQTMSDPETLAELRATRPWLRASFAPLLEFMPEDDAAAGERPAASTTELRRRLDAASALDSVLSKGPSEQVVEEAERILRGTRLEGMGMDTVESALLALTYAEYPHRAAPWCDELMKEAGTREAPGRQARLSAIRSEISVRQGDLPGAEQFARKSLEMIPVSGWGVTVGSCLGSLVTALAAMGRHDEAADTLNQPVPEAMLDSRFGLHYLRGRGRYNLAIGDYDGAMADFRYCGEQMGRWELDVPGLIAWRNDLAEVLLQLNELEAARWLLEEQLAKCDRRVSPRTHGTALRLLAATYELRQRPMLLRQAADVLQGSSDRYALAMALYDLTTAYHQLGEPRRAQVIGRQAWSIAKECHADPLARLLASDAGQQEAEQAAPAAPPTAVLSDAEQRVANLVIMGHTNREIAKRLYITMSTVEQHLTRAYRKLNVTCRADLALALSARAEQAASAAQSITGPTGAPMTPTGSR